MKIRPENKDDHDAITETTIAAFEYYPLSQQTEHLIIDELRKDNALTVSLVAVINEKVTGHIAFSPVNISDGTSDWYGLGPVSVLPQFQGQGIGSKLMRNWSRSHRHFYPSNCCFGNSDIPRIYRKRRRT